MSFWRGVFSEQDGTPSFSRVATAFLVSGAIAWVTVIVARTHELPSLDGLALFMGTLYGTNILGSVGKGISKNGQN